MAKTKADRIMEMAANVALSEIGAGPEITGFSDRDEARAALAALVDEAANAPDDPALLALATLRDATDEEVAELEEEVREASARVAELKAEYALARFGAYVVRDWFRRGSGFQAADGFLLDEGALGTGVVMRGVTVGYRHAPGIADAIARLLAPDGAASEGVTG